MAILNETEPTGPVPIRSVPPVKLSIKKTAGPKSPLARWLRVAQIIFFIGCGAVVVALEQIMKIFRSMDGGGGTVPSDRSGTRESPGEPQRIKVPMFPIDDYNRLNSKQVIHRLAGLSDEQLRIVREHEARQKNRANILEMIDRHLSGGG